MVVRYKRLVFHWAVLLSHTSPSIPAFFTRDACQFMLALCKVMSGYISFISAYFRLCQLILGYVSLF